MYLWIATNWQPRQPQHLYKDKPRPLNCGHRGAAALAPENTMLAFQAALKAGAPAVEFDVMFTSDRQLIVFHDYNLEKRLTSKGKISSMTLAQLQAIDISPYYSEHHPDKAMPEAFRLVRIPTLDEVLQFYSKYRDIILNIELKNEDLVDRGLERAVAEQIRKYNLQGRSIVSSFNPFSLWRFRRIMPEIPRGLIYSPKNPIYIRQLWFWRLAQPDALHPDHKLVNAEYMTWARKRGFAVHVWTVNKTDDIKRMISLGVDMIITDYPDRMSQILQRSARPSEK
jgi:glycerophosphoryl diester phosphodiesterase